MEGLRGVAVGMAEAIGLGKARSTWAAFEWDK